MLTKVTTASRISPLKGRKTTHWYLTGKVTKPVPSLISPLPILSTFVTATTNPCFPLFPSNSVVKDRSVHHRARHHQRAYKCKQSPAGSLHVLHKLGCELLVEMRPEVAGVKLHVPLQHHVEEHPSCSHLLSHFGAFFSAASDGKGLQRRVEAPRGDGPAGGAPRRGTEMGEVEAPPIEKRKTKAKEEFPTLNWADSGGGPTRNLNKNIIRTLYNK